MSAPSSDFTVSGSPVTKSGTLALKWTVAPTNADTANAIVKRDALGSFHAGAITASLGVTGLSASTAGVTGTNSSSGYGVYGTSVGGLGVYGTSSGGPAIWGESTGTSGGADGIHGVAHGPASGVAGINDSTSGVGVWGQGPGQAMYANGNVGQARASGGWVKAMVLYSGLDNGNIVYCFNSTLSGTAATTPPCGFFADKIGTGNYVIDFGFEMDDRFLSVTPALYSARVFTVCSNGTGCGLTGSQAAIFSYFIDFSNSSFDPADNKFYILVY